jgi:hypothetical protein
VFLVCEFSLIMDVLPNILTILNLCSVQFYGMFDSHTAFRQSLVPAVIVINELRSSSQNTTGILKPFKPSSLSQKCHHSSIAIIAFISINDRFKTNISVDPFQKNLILNRYELLITQASSFSNPKFVLLQINDAFKKHPLIFD